MCVFKGFLLFRSLNSKLINSLPNTTKIYTCYVLGTSKNKNEVCTAFACLTVFLFTTKYQQNARCTYSVPINLELSDKRQF